MFMLLFLAGIASMLVVLWILNVAYVIGEIRRAQKPHASHVQW